MVTIVNPSCTRCTKFPILLSDFKICGCIADSTFFRCYCAVASCSRRLHQTLSELDRLVCWVACNRVSVVVLSADCFFRDSFDLLIVCTVSSRMLSFSYHLLSRQWTVLQPPDPPSRLCHNYRSTSPAILSLIHTLLDSRAAAYVV